MTNRPTQRTAFDSLRQPIETGQAVIARGYHRMNRVARTIADLDGSETIRRPHIAEAPFYRRIAPGR